MSIKYLLFCIIINISLINSIRLVDNDYFTPQLKNLVRKINRLSESSENKAIMEILVDRLKNYLLYHKYDKERKECPYEKYKNIYELKKNFTADDEGTYDVYSHQRLEFDSGYQVSFETAFDDYTPEDYTELCYMMSLITDNKIYFGYWGGSSEFSFFSEDLDLAYVISIVFNQMAIFDWGTRSDINNPYFKEISN